MTDEEFDQKKTELAEYLDERDRAVKEHDGFVFGERIRVLEDDEDQGLYADDEGVLIIEKVGHPGGHNERTAVYLIVDGTDSPVEIHAGHEIESA